LLAQGNSPLKVCDSGTIDEALGRSCAFNERLNGADIMLALHG
jgi:hypothetical protein